MDNDNNKTLDTEKQQTTTQHKGTLKLKEWALEDRPREKLITKGKKELSNAELLAILLGSGTVGQSAVELAKEILRSNDNDLSALSRQGIAELTRGYKGIGEAKAITIIAAMELGYRMLTEGNDRKIYILTDSEKMFNYISPSIIDLPHEEFWAIYMNFRNKVLRIFSTALEKKAVNIIVAHNHPTGNLTPSPQDKNLTKSIMEAGKILRINLLDHLIVGIRPDGIPDYYSFHDEGLL